MYATLLVDHIVPTYTIPPPDAPIAANHGRVIACHNVRRPKRQRLMGSVVPIPAGCTQHVTAEDARAFVTTMSGAAIAVKIVEG